MTQSFFTTACDIVGGAYRGVVPERVDVSPEVRACVAVLEANAIRVASLLNRSWTTPWAEERAASLCTSIAEQAVELHRLLEDGGVSRPLGEGE
jgi:hypothetical protein